jgi:HD-like signal output (HDOD) protein
MHEPDEGYRALRRLPPFLPVATKLLLLLEDDNVSVNKIAERIRADVALTAGIVAHRPFPHLWLLTRIRSLQTSVIMMGFQTVGSLALTVGMK